MEESNLKSAIYLRESIIAISLVVLCCDGVLHVQVLPCNVESSRYFTYFHRCLAYTVLINVEKLHEIAMFISSLWQKRYGALMLNYRHCINY